MELRGAGTGEEMVGRWQDEICVAGRQIYGSGTRSASFWRPATQKELFVEKSAARVPAET